MIAMVRACVAIGLNCRKSNPHIGLYMVRLLAATNFKCGMEQLLTTQGCQSEVLRREDGNAYHLRGDTAP